MAPKDNSVTRMSHIAFPHMPFGLPLTPIGGNLAEIEKLMTAVPEKDAGVIKSTTYHGNVWHDGCLAGVKRTIGK